jgi:hypothetical protein
MGEFFEFLLILGTEVALSPVGLKVFAGMLVPGELHGIAIPGFGVEAFSLPQGSRVRLKILAVHTTNQIHIASLVHAKPHGKWADGFSPPVSVSQMFNVTRLADSCQPRQLKTPGRDLSYSWAEPGTKPLSQAISPANKSPPLSPSRKKPGIRED